MDNFQQDIVYLVQTLSLTNARSLLRHLERNIKHYQKEATEIAEKIESLQDDVVEDRIIDYKLAFELLHLWWEEATKRTKEAELVALDLNLGLTTAHNRGKAIKATRKALQKNPPQHMVL